jgi:hypothetical protein
MRSIAMTTLLSPGNGTSRGFSGFVTFQGIARRKIFLCLRQPPNSPPATRVAAGRDGAAPPWPRRQAGQQLVEEGFESILTRKHNPNSARKRIFDGEKEARLITLACSSPPAGCARWTLQLLEEKVVELAIVDHASDNTIGRALKKTF